MFTIIFITKRFSDLRKFSIKKKKNPSPRHPPVVHTCNAIHFISFTWFNNYYNSGGA